MINTALAKQRRADLGLSQDEVAKRVGVGRQSIYEWETGKHEPANLLTLKAYAAALEVSVEELAADPEVAASP